MSIMGSASVRACIATSTQLVVGFLSNLLVFDHLMNY